MHRLAYVSHAGERVELDGPTTYVGTALSLRTRAWEYTLGYRSVSGVSQTAREVSAEAHFTDLAEADRARRVFDSDVSAGMPGRVVSGEWERPAYCFGIEPTALFGGYVAATLAFALTGQWRKYEEASFSSVPPVLAHGYPHGYPHTYGYAGATRSLDTGVSVPCRPRITVYGPVSEPRVQVGGNVHRVSATVPEGAYMVIDGLERTVKTHMQDGTVRDDFAAAARAEGEYVFEPIPPGVQSVSWGGSYGIDVGWWIEESGLPWTA